MRRRQERDREIASRHALNTPEVDDEIERAMRTVEAMDNLDNNGTMEDEQVVQAGPPRDSVEQVPVDLNQEQQDFNARAIEARRLQELRDAAINRDTVIDLNDVRGQINSDSATINDYSDYTNNVSAIRDSNAIDVANIGRLTSIDDSELRGHFDDLTPIKKTKKVRMTEESATSFADKIVRIAEGVLGKDNVSLELNGQGRNVSTVLQRSLVLKWDFITIRNRNGVTHDIKDIYVALPLNSSLSKFSGSLYGMRGTISALEYTCGYRHSHLTASNNYFGAFCTGADGINDLWAELQLGSNISEDFDIKLEGFIHQMESFLSYESLEGIPYFRITGMNSSARSNRIRPGAINNAVQAFARRIPFNNIDLSMDFNTGIVKVVETEYLHNEMVMLTTNHQTRSANGFYVDLGVSQTMRNVRANEINDSHLSFKGEKRIQIEAFQEQEQDKVSQNKLYAHGSISRKFIETIERQGQQVLKEYCLKEFIFNEDEEEGQIGTRRKFKFANPLYACNTTEQRVVGAPILEDERRSGSGKTRVDSTEF